MPCVTKFTVRAEKSSCPRKLDINYLICRYVTQANLHWLKAGGNFYYFVNQKSKNEVY